MDGETIARDGAELLTVLIPCLNEERTITPTVRGILDVAPSLPLDLEIWLIDDGSTDRTADRMTELCEEHAMCNMRINPRNLGVGSSVLSTYEMVRPGSWVTVIPGDNEFVFESIHNFVDVRDRYDIILGYFQNPVIRPFPRRMGSYAFTKLVSTLYGFSFRYLNGMKMYRIEAFRGIDVHSGGHAYNAELLAKAILRNPRLRIGEVPFIARGRASGSSSAFRPASVVRAMRELRQGARAVSAYRAQVIQDEEQ